MSKLQKFVYISSIEAEYVPIVDVGEDLIWLVDYFEGLDNTQHDKVLFIDSQGAIQL